MSRAVQGPNRSATVEGITLGAPGPPPGGEPLKKSGIDPRRAPDSWVPVTVSVFKTTPEVGDHPVVLPVSFRQLATLQTSDKADRLSDFLKGASGFWKQSRLRHWTKSCPSRNSQQR